MCLICDGSPPSDLLDAHRRAIGDHGWSIEHVEPSQGLAAVSYTIGLTRFHGHPEMLVTGLDPVDATAMLEGFGELVRAGARFATGDLVAADEGHRIQLVQVLDPRVLVCAQAIYADPGPAVPALQAVWSDHRGHWPWCRHWPGHPGDQPLFGRPLHDE
jgi:hypothetical protein